jgi:RNA polymerase sigma-70 factor (ECF subfamily)
MDAQDLMRALGELTDDQREALILVGAEGFAYEEAAEICNCAVGTIKSRVNRARNRLVEILGLETVKDFGPEPLTEAVLLRNS